MQVRFFNTSAVSTGADMPKVKLDSASSSSSDGSGSDGLDNPYRGPTVNITKQTPASTMNVPIKVTRGKNYNDDKVLLQQRLEKLRGEKRPVVYYPITDQKR